MRRRLLMRSLKKWEIIAVDLERFDCLCSCLFYMILYINISRMGEDLLSDLLMD